MTPRLSRPPWLRPTLLGRMTLSLVFAYALVWLAMVGWEYHASTDERRIAGNMADYMADQAQALGQFETAPEAIAYVKSLEHEYNLYRGLDGRPEALMELRGRDGMLLFGHGRRMPESSSGTTAFEAGDQRYLVFRADSARWAFRLGYPIQSLSNVIRVIGAALNLRLLLSVPCLMLPLWLALRQGLKPLHVLARRIAQRRPDDLSALDYRARHAELIPLTRALDSLLRQLREAVAREHAFVQDAAHELRTPLAVLAAQLHVLTHAQAPAEREEARRQAEAALVRGSHLVAQLLELARLDVAAQACPEPVDLAAVTRGALAQAAPRADARGVTLSLDAPDALAAVVDRPAFESILHNLVDNAIRYVQPGARVEVELIAGRRPGHVQLVVSDDGPGIPPEQRARVFERFHRGQGHDAPGTGLGLAIVAQAAARLGAGVQLREGAGGRGCRFEVAWPAAPDREHGRAR